MQNPEIDFQLVKACQRAIKVRLVNLERLLVSLGLEVNNDSLLLFSAFLLRRGSTGHFEMPESQQT